MPLDYVESQRGHRHLVHNGHRFVTDYEKALKTYWKCAEYKTEKRCRARIHTFGGKIVGESGVHYHPPSPQIISGKKIMSEVKKLAATSSDKPMSILARVTENAAPEVKGSLPSVQALCKQMARARKEVQFPNTIPTRTEDIVLTREFQVLGKGGQFLQFDSGPENNRILIFCAAENLRMLAHAEHIYADGTFKTTPHPLFEQLYSIHADLGGRVVPLVFALLKNKDSATYARMLAAVKRLSQGMNPTTITTDYELASIDSFRQAFPNARMKGCWFHFGQCMWCQIQSLPDVLQRYRNDTPFQVQVKCLGALSFVPPAEVVNAYETLANSPFYTAHDCLQPLLSYFEKNWIGELNHRTRARRTPRFAIDLWNNRESILNEHHLTTNSLEGWHHQLHGRIGATHPNIWKYLTFLKQEQSLVEAKIEAFLKGERPTPVLKYQRIYEKIRNATLNWGAVDTLDFLRGISYSLQWDV